MYADAAAPMKTRWTLADPTGQPMREITQSRSAPARAATAGAIALALYAVLPYGVLVREVPAKLTVRALPSAAEARLRNAICALAGGAAVLATVVTDPEEGWSRAALVVETGLDDMEARLALEDRFYALTYSDALLSDALRELMVIFR